MSYEMTNVTYRSPFAVLSLKNRLSAKEAGITSMDILLTGMLVLILSPLLLALAASIKLTSKGPVIFKQNRVGLDGRVFTIDSAGRASATSTSGTALWSYSIVPLRDAAPPASPDHGACPRSPAARHRRTAAP